MHKHKNACIVFSSACRAKCPRCNDMVVHACCVIYPPGGTDQCSDLKRTRVCVISPDLVTHLFLNKSAPPHPPLEIEFRLHCSSERKIIKEAPTLNLHYRVFFCLFAQYSSDNTGGSKKVTFKDRWQDFHQPQVWYSQGGLPWKQLAHMFAVMIVQLLQCTLMQNLKPCMELKPVTTQNDPILKCGRSSFCAAKEFIIVGQACCLAFPMALQSYGTKLLTAQLSPRFIQFRYLFIMGVKH